MVNGHRRLEDLSSMRYELMFIKTLVTGIELIELRS
jgi:hypothetical protein